MMVLEGHSLDVAPKSKVANMLFLAAQITSQLGLKKPAVAAHNVLCHLRQLG